MNDSKTASEGHWVIKTSSLLPSWRRAAAIIARTARSHDRVGPRSGIASTLLARRVLQLADRNGNATFEPPINHHRRRRSDLRRLDERTDTAFAENIYPSISGFRRSGDGLAWSFTAVAQIKPPPSKTRRGRRCTRALGSRLRLAFCNATKIPPPPPAPRLLRILNPALVLEDIPGERKFSICAKG